MNTKPHQAGITAVTGTWIRAHAVTLVLAAAAVLVAAIPAGAAALQFDRAALGDGQWYRALTGHWTHWSSHHLFWDALTFVVLGVIAERFSRMRMLAVVFGSALVVSAGVLLVEGDMAIYRGLSGIDSALFIFVTLMVWHRARVVGDTTWRWVAGIAVVAFTAKIVFEWMTGDTLFVDRAAGDFVPLPLAHVLGGAVGAGVACLRPIRHSRDEETVNSYC